MPHFFDSLTVFTLIASITIFKTTNYSIINNKKLWSSLHKKHADNLS